MPHQRQAQRAPLKGYSTGESDGFYDRGVGFADTGCKALILLGMVAIRNISALEFSTASLVLQNTTPVSV
jgi:hypothetical protein